MLARKVLAENGVVCGAAWDGDCRHVRHILVESEGELDRVMRSKYTQSSIGREVYESVLKALRLGRRVLFAGTACQVAGLKAYLGKMAEATYLYTVDVVCHGVPSPLLWENWVEYREECTGAMLREVNMRDKATGWLSYSVVYRYNAVKDGFAVSDSCVAVNDWYFKAFLNNASLRSSCFSCSSKRSCGSDVTLGDFWGFQDLYPNIDSSQGVSAVLCNTEKGVALVHGVLGETEHGGATYAEIVEGNPALEVSASPHPQRAAFMGALSSGVPIRDMVRRWSFEDSVWLRTKRKLKRLLKL